MSQSRLGDRNAGSGAVSDGFVHWQCMIRQIAMRKEAGRPSPGMCPRVTFVDGRLVMGAMASVLVLREPEECTAFFRHLVRRTNDPREIREKGLQLLQSTHYQTSGRFSDELAALFPAATEAAARLMDAGQCTLVFDQFSRHYTFKCGVRALSTGHDEFEFVLWHNRIFNPELPDDVTILGFRPDWSTVEKDS